MDFKRALLAAVLSIAVLFAWQMLVPQAERSGREASTAQEPARDGVAGEAPVVEPGGASGGAVDSWSLGEPALAPDADDGIDDGGDPGALESELAADDEHTMTLETRDFRAEFSNRGGELVSLQLWQHQEASGDLVDLVQERAAGHPYPFGFVNPADGSAHPLSEALFVAKQEVDSDGLESLVFEYRGPLGTARKRFSLAGEAIRAQVEASGGWALLWGPGLRNLPPGASGSSRFEKRSVVWRRDGDVDRDDVNRLSEVTRFGPGGLDWVGVDDTYFMSVVLPQEGLGEVVIYPLVEGSGSLRRLEEGEKPDKELRREAEILLLPEQNRLRVAAYMGTKEFDHLEGLPRDLAEAGVQTGFLGALARPLQVALRWIYAHLVGNYGWAIVILTLGVKVLLFPLTQKSMVSMARMQELNPKIQSIRGKYRPKLKDKQGRPNAEAQRKMNEEIMALYKSEGVNPAGGCLPMIVQLPIFFALFRLLGSAIELRNAPWIFWITDLSAPDPWKVMPVLMGASQLLQQKMTPTSADPMQKRLMTFMPIMFVFFALAFPSGLVLYWLTSNILTIVQNSLYNRWKQRAAASARGET